MKNDVVILIMYICAMVFQTTMACFSYITHEDGLFILTTITALAITVLYIFVYDYVVIYFDEDEE